MNYQEKKVRDYQEKKAREFVEAVRKRLYELQAEDEEREAQDALDVELHTHEPHVHDY